ncbi:MAG: saccharopine dehydrogenase NADP-binding domain-containing protein [Mycobacteriales bacterium]
MSRIVLFGATGYTGRLVAAALVARGADPVLAARDRGRAEALAIELAGPDRSAPEVAEADVHRPETVRALVERGDVLVSTVGPFARWGAAALQAAVGAGARYLDSTGEPGFIRDVFHRWGPRAAGAGAALVPAFGYDWVPGNLAGALALRDGGDEVTRLDIGYFVTGSTGLGSLSGGTMASAAGVLGTAGYAWRGGRLVEEMPARHHRTYRVHGSPRSGLSVAGSEHLALPRLAPGLRDVHVHLGWFGPAARPVQVLSQLTRLPVVPRLVESVGGRLLRGSTGGPDESSRRRSGTHVQAVAYAADDRELSRVALDGPNPYTLTGGLLAWAAVRARDGGLTGVGALGPVEAFGLDELAAGAAEAGLHRG